MRSLWKRLVQTAGIVLLLGTTSAVAVAPGGFAKTPAKRTPLIHATLLTNWYAEAEHGGFYAAQALGLYKKMGLDLTIQSGGPRVQPVTQLVTGKVQFAMLSAATLLTARAEGLPIVSVFATFQDNPEALMYHANAGIHSFRDLSGKTIYISAGVPWWPYLVAKYGIKNYKEFIYNGSLALFAANKDAVTQIYTTDEPYVAQREGLKVGWLTLASGGFNMYANIICTTESYLKEHPAAVAAFVRASQEGWAAFLADPRRFYGVIKAANPDTTLGQFLYSARAERPLILGGDAARYGIGWQSAARYRELEAQLLSVKYLKTPVNVSAIFTDRFLQHLH